jgi:hypothetical protein
MRADETPEAELWRRTLTQIPSLLGRLIYLASLRDLNTGQYQHFGFAQQVGDKASERTIRRSHTNAFEDWLCLSLSEQREQLDRHLEATEVDRVQVLAHWTEFPPYLSWVPSHARPAEKDLFRADLEIVIDLIMRENSAASPSRSASPLPLSGR